MKNLLIRCGLSCLSVLWFYANGIGLHAADMSFGPLYKGLYYVQTNASGTVPATGTNYAGFGVFMMLNSSNAVTNATLHLPNGTNYALNLSQGGMQRSLEQYYATTNALNAAFPDGLYRVDLYGKNDGFHQAQVTLTGNTFPNPPFINNFTAAQNINPANGFTLYYDPLAGGTANDFVQLRIEDANGDNTIYQTGMPGSSNALNGTMISCVIPAGVLVTGTTYRASLMFDRVVSADMINYPGAVISANYIAQTVFGLATRLTTAPDAIDFGLVKGLHYQQTSVANVALSANYAELSAWVDSSSNNSVTNASLMLPNFTTINLPASGSVSYELGTNFSSLSALDLAFPNGQYVARLYGRNDGFIGIPLSLASNTTPLYPATPTIVNFDAAQIINPTNSFMISWGAFSNATASDHIHIRITDPNTDSTIWRTPDFGQAGSLDGLATSATIPPNVLPTNVTLQGELVFARVISVDTNTYPGVYCFSAFYKRTKFPVATYLALPADVSRAAVRKGLFYQQTSSSSVGPQTGTKAARFDAYVVMNSSNAVSTAQVLLPNFAVQTLGQPDPFNFNYRSNFTSVSSMDLAFPNGQYVLMMTGNHDGYHPVPVFLTNNAYPNPPQVLNFDLAQSVNVSNDFTLSWSAFTNGTTTNDFVVVMISDGNNTIWQTPGIGQSGMLSGLNTSVMIPAYSLPPGHSLSVQIFFAKNVYWESQTYAGVPCAAMYYSATAVPIGTSGQVDSNSPSLWQTSPNQDQPGAPTNSGVALTFDEPMQTGISISWSVPNPFNYMWSADRRTLFCVPQTPLPGNTTISFTLNPSGYSASFCDLSGNPLPQNTGREFQTANTVVTPDVKAFSVYKGISYLQTNASAVVLNTNQPPFLFGASVDLKLSASVTNATLRYASGMDQPMAYEDDSFGFDSSFATSNLLQTARPDGDYTLTMYTVHDGVRTTTLNLTGNNYPGVPRVSNWAAAQAVNASNSFTLTWDAFNNAHSNAMIQVSIRLKADWGDHNVFETPGPGEPGAMSATNTACVIPVNTLSPGRGYEVELMFVNLIQTNSSAYPGVPCVSGYAAINKFSIICTGIMIRPQLQFLGFNGGRSQVRINGLDSIPYTIEVSDNLAGNSWRQYFSQTTTNSLGGFEDWNMSPSATNRFYRLREGW